jgi:uncharacterized membrane protein
MEINNFINQYRSQPKRYTELDFLKGIALILMIIYHYFYSYYLNNTPIIPINNDILSLIGVISNNLFIVIFGINYSISFQKDKNKNNKEFWIKQIKRFGTYLIISLIISGITYNIFPSKYVRFGIFHFFTASILLAIPFVQNIKMSSLGLLLFTGLYYLINTNQSMLFNKCQTNPLVCFITGIANTKYASMDHFYIIPYFILVLLGIIIGQVVYNNNNNNNNKNNNNNSINYIIKNNLILNSIAYLGTKTIIIYIVQWIILYYLVTKSQ